MSYVMKYTKIDCCQQCEPFLARSKGWLLMENQNPKHCSNLSRNRKTEHGIKQLPWTAFSPSMNPTENVLALFKTKVSMRKPSNLKGLIKAIKTEWNMLPGELVRSLISSMESRIESVIESNDDDTTY